MTKVEEVAAAMAEATNGGKWDDGHYADDHKALWMKRAEAAIKAMREPSDAMLEAVAGMEHIDRDPSYYWPKMIDAALAEKP